MINFLQCTIRLWKSVEGYKEPFAHLMYDTPDGEKEVSGAIAINKFPKNTYEWLLEMRNIINSYIEIYEDMEETK